MESEKPLLIFDMDGVLIDVSGSYREVVRRASVTYLRSVLGAEAVSDDAVTLADVDAVKKTGGLNNDWDLTYAIIDAVLGRSFDRVNGALGEAARALSGYGGAPDGGTPAGETPGDREILSMVRTLGERFDTRPIVETLGEGPVRELVAAAKGGGVRGSGRSPFLFNRGEVGTGNLVKRIFQELYLGTSLFSRIYGSAPLFYNGAGYIARERLIPALSHLEEIESRAVLAIATGRPGVEARFPLARFGIERFFRAIVSEDDVASEEERLGRSLRKPDPFSITLAVERSGFRAAGHGVQGRSGARRGGPGRQATGTQGPVFYLGDMPDDVTAALGAGVHPLGFVDEGPDGASGVEMPEERRESAQVRARHRTLLSERGAVEVFGNFDEVAGYLRTVAGPR